MKPENAESTVIKGINVSCCPIFHPERWDEKTFQLNQKKFIKESISEFLYIPFPTIIAKKVTKMIQLAKDARHLDLNTENILLWFTDLTPFKGEIYLSVTAAVPAAENVIISGTFIAKVFDGAFNNMPKFIKQMDFYLAKQKKKPQQYYVHYAYCPKCAKKEGHNYILLFAELES